jgi:hypothetical protein
MRITRRQLRHLISEELKVVSEGILPDADEIAARVINTLFPGCAQSPDGGPCRDMREALADRIRDDPAGLAVEAGALLARGAKEELKAWYRENISPDFTGY